MLFRSQEYLREYVNRINVFDRDFLTILAYQKYILQKEYGSDYKKFYTPFKEMLLFDLKPIETIAYIQVPIDVSVERIKLRGREKPYTQKQIEFLEAVKFNFEKELIPEVRDLGIDVTILNGLNSPKENAELVYKKVRKL